MCRNKCGLRWEGQIYRFVAAVWEGGRREGRLVEGETPNVSAHVQPRAEEGFLTLHKDMDV